MADDDDVIDDAPVELSVVIVSYRCAGLLRACLESWDAYRADVVMEVEVLDNASGDGTIDAARGFDWVRATALKRERGLRGRQTTSACREHKAGPVLVL